MNKTGKIVIGTSISPYNVDKQKRAVTSWINSGFDVISCNSETEIWALKDIFKGVTFVKTDRDAYELTGKRVPYLYDILMEASVRADGICGFSNADIVLECVTDGMYQYIKSEARNSLLFLRRNEVSDIHNIGQEDFTIHFDGIDTFFMDIKLVKDFFDERFSVQTVWDCCILSAAKQKNIPIKELVNPIAFHEEHKIQWDYITQDQLVSQFAEKYCGIHENAFANMKKKYYDIIYNKCERVCYVEENAGYDFNVIADEEVKLDKTFKELVAWMMNHYPCRQILVDSFFFSEESGKVLGYNEIDRNIEVLHKINKKNKWRVKVVANNITGDEKVLIRPVAHRTIDINDSKHVKQIHLSENTYLMPAGVRGCEWYSVNKKVVGNKVRGFIDNDKEKYNTELCGLRIFSIERLRGESRNANIVIASKYYANEIFEQVRDYLDASQIFNASYMLKICGDGTIYYFDDEIDYKLKG